MAKSIIGKENFFEIYLSTPLEICKKRDQKGIYKVIEKTLGEKSKNEHYGNAARRCKQDFC